MKPVSVLSINSKFTKKVATLSAGVFIAQILSVLLTPIVTRLYLPDDYGFIAYLLAIGGVFGNISTLKYDHAILVAEDKAMADRLLMLSLLIAICFSLVFFVLILFFLFFISPFTRLGNYVCLLPFLIVTGGIHKTLINYNNKISKYRRIAVSNIGAGLSTPLVRIAYATALKGSAVGLLVGHFASAFLKIFVLKSRVAFLKKWKENNNGFLATASQYKDFPFFSVPNALLFSITMRAPFLLLGFFYDPKIVGFYALSERVLKTPLGLVAEPIRRVFIQRFDEKIKNKEVIFWQTIKLSAFLFLLLLPLFLIISMFGADIFVLIFGKKWLESGAISGIIFPWIYISFIVTPISSIYILLRKQHIWLQFQTLLALGTVGLFLLLFYSNIEYFTFLKLFTLFNSVVYFVAFLHIILLSKSFDSSLRNAGY